MARYLFSVLALATAWLAPRSALACSCMEQPFETARAEAAAIFEARVTAIEPAGSMLRVHLDVVQTWRAAEHEHVEVVTAGDSAMCGYAFEVGRSYLVYASGVDGEAYRVSLCSRTQPMESADDDRAMLGSGVVPVDIADAPESEPATQPPPTRAGCASCSVGASRSTPEGAALVGLSLLAIFVQRGRRGSLARRDQP